MKVLPRFLYLGCFIGLAAVAALALDRVVQPSLSAVLLRAVFLAAFCAAPGLVWRRLWPLAVVLLPIGCYVLLRTTVALPASVESLGQQLHFYAAQLELGGAAYQASVFPLPVGDFPEIKVLLAFSAYWLLAGAAFVGLALRRAMPAVVLLCALLGYGFTVGASSRALWSALVFAVLSVCLIVIARGLGRAGWRLRDLVAGGAVGVIASLLALALVLGAPAVVANPWQDWRAWDPFGQGGSIYTFNWLQNYPRLLDPDEDREIMRVETPAPSYWRANALDTFTGTAWVTSQAFLVRVDPLEEDDATWSFELPATELMPTGETVTEVFHIQDAFTNYFFAGGDPQALHIDQSIALRMNSMRSLRVGTALGPTLDYSLTAVIPRLEPSALVGLGTDYPDGLERYQTLPWGTVADLTSPDKDAEWRAKVESGSLDGWEWTELYSLNRRVIGEATDPYQIALRIERYLRRYFTYTLDPPESRYFSPYSAFLFDKRTGYCQHFSGAMALLLRYNGIPARVAVGFATGKLDADGSYVVSTNNAHAWVEAYFPRVGWVAFDPTPGRNLPSGGPSASSAGFVDPYGELPSQGSSTPENSLPTPTLPDGTPDVETPSSPGDEGGQVRLSWLPWVVGLAVVVGGWPFARRLWRERRLRQGSAESRLQASLGLLRADLADYALPVTAALTLEEVLHLVKDSLGIEPDPALPGRADAVLFGDRPATIDDVRRAEAVRTRVRTRLRRTAGWAKALRAWYGLPGSRRTAFSASRRRFGRVEAT